MALGVDLSENNGFTEWDTLIDAGVEFVILRAGYGQGNLDSAFYRAVEEVKARGLKLGAYWFSYALDVSQARREGAFCREIIDNTGALFDLPIFYDQENSNWRTNHNYDVSIATDQCDAFYEGLGGLNMGVYANYNWFKNYLDYDYLAGKYTIWLAQYAREPGLPCGIWQYSERGTIGGNFPIDLDTAQF